MLTDILAVAGGFVVWSVLWLGGSRLVLGLFPGAMKADGSVAQPGALAALLVFAALVSAAAGYVVPLISAGANLPLILGGLLLVVGIFVQSQSWKLLPLWYHLLFLALLIPATLWGAGLGS